MFLLCVKGCQSMCDPWHRLERSESGADRRCPEESHRNRLCQNLPAAEAHHCRGLPEAGWCILIWLYFTWLNVGYYTYADSRWRHLSVFGLSRLFLPDNLFCNVRLNRIFDSHLYMTLLIKVWCVYKSIAFFKINVLLGSIHIKLILSCAI